MHLAMKDMYRAKWTDLIHEEWIRNLLENRPDLTKTQLERTRDLMNAHVRDCLVTGFEDLVEALTLPDPDARHVLAAAIRCGASAIVTSNLKDFPDEVLSKYGVEALHPDDFLTLQLDLSPSTVCEAAKCHRESLKNPRKTVDDYLNSLEAQSLPQTVARLREFSRLI
jgi:hypothetical protein